MAFWSIGLSLAAALIELLGRGKLVVIIPYGIVNPLLVLVPRIIFAASRKFRQSAGAGWLSRMERLVFLVLLINIPGSLILHDLGIQYDRLLHLAASLLATLIIYEILKPLARERALLPAVLITFAGLFAFEGLQFSIDAIFNTNLFFDAAQNTGADFWEDIAFGVAGLIIAAVYLRRKL